MFVDFKRELQASHRRMNTIINETIIHPNQINPLIRASLPNSSLGKMVLGMFGDSEPSKTVNASAITNIMNASLPLANMMDAHQ